MEDERDDDDEGEEGESFADIDVGDFEALD